MRLVHRACEDEEGVTCGAVRWSHAVEWDAFWLLPYEERCAACADVGCPTAREMAEIRARGVGEVMTIPVIPISEADEAIVDVYVREHQQPRAGRPINDKGR